MKLDAITVAAVAVAGLALVTWSRSHSKAAAAGQPTTLSSTLDAIYGNARSQRQDSGSAIAQNTAYLEFWDSPMANTLYSTGSLGD